MLSWCLTFSFVAVKLFFSSNHPYSLMCTEVESFLHEYRKGPSLLAKGQLLIPEMEIVVFSELKWKMALMSNQRCTPGSAQGLSRASTHCFPPRGLAAEKICAGTAWSLAPLEHWKREKKLFPRSCHGWRGTKGKTSSGQIPQEIITDCEELGKGHY